MTSTCADHDSLWVLDSEPGLLVRGGVAVSRHNALSPFLGAIRCTQLERRSSEQRRSRPLALCQPFRTAASLGGDWYFYFT